MMRLPKGWRQEFDIGTWRAKYVNSTTGKVRRSMPVRQRHRGLAAAAAKAAAVAAAAASKAAARSASDALLWSGSLQDVAEDEQVRLLVENCVDENQDQEQSLHVEHESDAMAVNSDDEFSSESSSSESSSGESGSDGHGDSSSSDEDIAPAEWRRLVALQYKKGYDMKLERLVYVHRETGERSKFPHPTTSIVAPYLSSSSGVS